MYNFMMVSKIKDFRIPHKNVIFMMEIKAKTRKWGNSIGVLIPQGVVEEEKIKPNQEITLMISTKTITRGKDIWGTMKF